MTFSIIYNLYFCITFIIYYDYIIDFCEWEGSEFLGEFQSNLYLNCCITFISAYDGMPGSGKLIAGPSSSLILGLVCYVNHSGNVF